jgi:hypothetical protein
LRHPSQPLRPLRAISAPAVSDCHTVTVAASPTDKLQCVGDNQHLNRPTWILIEQPQARSFINNFWNLSQIKTFLVCICGGFRPAYSSAACSHSSDSTFLDLVSLRSLSATTYPTLAFYTRRLALDDTLCADRSITLVSNSYY